MGYAGFVLANLLRNKLRSALTGSAITAAGLHGLDGGPHHARMAMPQDQRPPRADKVEVFVAVEVDEMRPLAPSDEQRFAADGPKGARRAVHAAGNDLAGTFEGFMAEGTVVGW